MNYDNNIKIPKIIHQIWLQGENNIPTDYPNYSDSWKKLNPDFKYILWDQNSIENLIKQHFPYFLSKFNSYPKLVQKVDAAKYMILYVYGGIYVDMDLECIKNINNLIINNQIILLKCDMNIIVRIFFYHTINTIIQNCFAASVPNHPFWKYCVELMLKQDLKQHNYELLEKYIFRTTGPGLFTQAYYSFKPNNNFTLLDTNVIEPFSSCEYDLYNCSKEDCKKRLINSYAMHHFGAKHSTHGWLSSSGKTIMPILCTNQNLIIYGCCFVIIIIIIFLIIWYTKSF